MQEEWEKNETLKKQTLEAEQLRNKRETRALDEPYVDEVLTSSGPADVVQAYVDWFYSETPGDPGEVGDRVRSFMNQVQTALNENIQGSFRFSLEELSEEETAIATRLYLFQTMADGSDEGAAREMALFDSAKTAIGEVIRQRSGG